MTELFYAVLKASLQGSIVILAVILLRLVLKKVPRSVFCLLWLLAGLRLVLPFEIESNLSLQPRLEEPELSIQVQLPAQTPPVTTPARDAAEPDPAPAPEQTPALPDGNWEIPQSESFLYQVQDGVITGPLTFGDIAAWVWLAGMGVMVLASLWSYLKLKRRVRESYLIENGCFECPGLETAFVLGFLPPRIYLPAGLTDQEKRFVFEHENTHIARHDHWYKLLGYLVLSLHWFNPLVWIGYGALCRDIELACDEHVVKYMSLAQRKAYSAALLSCGGHTAGLAACPVAFGESNPKQRILNVLNYKRPTFWISLTAVIAVVFVAVCLMTSPNREEDPTGITSITPPENAEELEEQTRTLLTDYANQYIVNFQSKSEFKVDEFLNTWVYCQGDDWIVSEGGDTSAELYAVLDGVGFTKENDITDFSSNARTPDHWLLSTDWENVDLEILDCYNGGTTIECIVGLPFTVNGETAPDFWLQLNLDNDGQLQSLTQRVCVDATRNGKAVSRQLKEENITIRSEDTTCIEYLGVDHGEEGDVHLYELSDIQVSVRMYLCVEISPSSIDLSRTVDISQYNICVDQNCTDDAHSHHKHAILTEDDYLEMCRDAVADIRTRENYHISEALEYRVNEQVDSRSQVDFWRDGANWIRESYVEHIRATRTHLYYDGYLYYKIQEGYGEPTWDRIDTANGAEYGLPWLHMLLWDEQIVTFEQAEQAGDMLHVVVTVHSTPQVLGWEDVMEYTVDFLFDEAGSLDSAVMSCIHEEIQVVSELRIEDTPAAEIRDEIEHTAAQRPPEVCVGLPLTKEGYLEKCRTALESYQAQESWVVLIERQFSGKDAPYDSSSQLWYGSGDDRLRQSLVSGADQKTEDWYLMKDGNEYSRRIHTIHDPANGESGDTGWVEGFSDGGEEITDPWPVGYEWDAQHITFVEHTTEGGSDLITLAIQGDPDEFDTLDVSEYQVTFAFRASGELWKVYMQYTQTRTIWINGAQSLGVSYVDAAITLNASAPEEAAKMIELKYQEAIG